MTTQSKPKRLTIEVPPDFHAEVKARAALRGIKMRYWVLRALTEKINQEKKYEQNEGI